MWHMSATVQEMIGCNLLTFITIFHRRSKEQALCNKQRARNAQKNKNSVQKQMQAICYTLTPTNNAGLVEYKAASSNKVKTGENNYGEK